MLPSRNRCEDDILHYCGIPFESAFRIDQKTMFWSNIYSDPSSCENEYVTSFVVKKDVFHAFFGDLDDSEMNIEYDVFQSNLPTSQVEGSFIDERTREQGPDLSPTAVSSSQTVTQSNLSASQREKPLTSVSVQSRKHFAQMTTLSTPYGHDISTILLKLEEPALAVDIVYPDQTEPGVPWSVRSSGDGAGCSSVRCSGWRVNTAHDCPG